MIGTSAVAHVCVESCRLYNTRPAHFIESNNHIHQPNSIDVVITTPSALGRWSHIEFIDIKYSISLYNKTTNKSLF